MLLATNRRRDVQNPTHTQKHPPQEQSCMRNERSPGICHDESSNGAALDQVVTSQTVSYVSLDGKEKFCELSEVE
jgi:hypothetical protein